MTQAHHEAHIRRSIENVFDFLADGSNNPAWQPFVISTTADAKSLGAGSTFHQMMRHPPVRVGNIVGRAGPGILEMASQGVGA